ARAALEERPRKNRDRPRKGQEAARQARDRESARLAAREGAAPAASPIEACAAASAAAVAQATAKVRATHGPPGRKAGDLTPCHPALERRTNATVAPCDPASSPILTGQSDGG